LGGELSETGWGGRVVHGDSLEKHTTPKIMYAPKYTKNHVYTKIHQKSCIQSMIDFKKVSQRCHTLLGTWHWAS